MRGWRERERESISDIRKVPQRNIIGFGSFVWQQRDSQLWGVFVNTYMMMMRKKKKNIEPFKSPRKRLYIHPLNA